MKKPEKVIKKYFNKYFKNQYIKETDPEFKSLIRIIKKFQREAIDEAVRECAESALIMTNNDVHGYYWVVDEQSILNVAERLRKEISWEK